jgi:hypothetical protein
MVGFSLKLGFEFIMVGFSLKLKVYKFGLWKYGDSAF